MNGRDRFNGDTISNHSQNIAAETKSGRLRWTQNLKKKNQIGEISIGIRIIRHNANIARSIQSLFTNGTHANRRPHPEES
jgi:hypothetical protein